MQRGSALKKNRRYLVDKITTIALEDRTNGYLFLLAVIGVLGNIHNIKIDKIEINEQNVCMKDYKYLLDKFDFIGRGAFGVISNYKCDNLSMNVIKLMESDDSNRNELIIHILCSQNHSPFIPSFYFGIDLSHFLLFLREKDITIPLKSFINTSFKEFILGSRDKKKGEIHFEDIYSKIENDEFETYHNMCIVMENGKKSSLLNEFEMIKELTGLYLNSKGKNEMSILLYLLEISLGMYVLHKNGYSHNDYRLNNSIYQKISYINQLGQNQNSVIFQLIDFGLSDNSIGNRKCGMGDRPPEVIGPHNQCSLIDPKTREEITDNNVWFKLDSYSLGQSIFTNWSVIENGDIGDIVLSIQNLDYLKRKNIFDLIQDSWEYIKQESLVMDISDTFHYKNICLKWLHYRGIGDKEKNIFPKNEYNLRVFGIKNFPDFIVKDLLECME